MSDSNLSQSNAKDPRFADERTITEFWASLGASNKTNTAAAGMPFGLGILLYFPLYVMKSLFVGSAIRYTLTNRRIRVDRGVAKRTVESFPLEEIVDVKLDDYIPFTRTGTLIVEGKSGELGRLSGIQDPEPARKTIMEAVRSRIEVSKVMQQQAMAPATA